MAIRTFNLIQINVGGTNPNRLWWDRDAAVTAATSATGWTVGKTAAVPANYRLLAQGQEIAGFSTTVQPVATAPAVDNSYATTATYTPPTLLNDIESISTLYEYNGVFESGDWQFNFPVIAVSSGGDADGRVRIRVYRALRSGTAWASVTELTSAALDGSIVSNLTTTTPQTSTVDWIGAPAFQLQNEFLVVKIAWQITGAGGANTRDVLLRYGSGANIITPDFKIKRHILT